MFKVCFVAQMIGYKYSWLLVHTYFISRCALSSKYVHMYLHRVYTLTSISAVSVKEAGEETDVNVYLRTSPTLQIRTSFV